MRTCCVSLFYCSSSVSCANFKHTAAESAESTKRSNQQKIDIAQRRRGAVKSNKKEQLTLIYWPVFLFAFHCI